MRGKHTAGIGKRRKRLQRTIAAAVMGLSVLCTGAAPSALLGTAFSIASADTAWAMEAGSYLVTVTPSYTDPETGKIEDPGNNEAIGQGMTQKLCGSQGLLEVDASGNMYLTVRYYLSQFVSDVSFEERSGGTYSTCPYERMQTKAPVSGSSNLDDKYGYTDYRMPIQSLSSVFRGKAYIEPMGRSVVYFFQASGPVAGSGDFVTSIQAEVPVQTEPPTEPEAEEELVAADERVETDRGSEKELREPEEKRETMVSRRETESYSRAQGSESSTVNGSGNADDPVTGIPAKPKAVSTAGTGSGIISDGEEDYYLETVYDLSAVPIKEARKLTEPMLENATGITITVGNLSKASVTEDTVGKDHEKNTNKSIMLVLLGISALLLVRFASAFLLVHRGAGARQEANENNFEQDEAERRRDQK